MTAKDECKHKQVISGADSIVMCMNCDKEWKIWDYVKEEKEQFLSDFVKELKERIEREWIMQDKLYEKNNKICHLGFQRGLEKCSEWLKEEAEEKGVKVE